jgi:hypothetical protein
MLPKLLNILELLVHGVVHGTLGSWEAEYCGEASSLPSKRRPLLGVNIVAFDLSSVIVNLF